MGVLLTLGIAAVFSLLTSLQSVFMALSLNKGEYDYATTAVNMTTDVIKWLISVAMIFWNIKTTGFNNTMLPDTGLELFKFSIPALLYTLKSILQFLAMLYLDAPSFQLLRNLNIISTGVMYHFFLGHTLDRRKMEALVLLATGLTIISVKDSKEEAGASMAGVIYCVLIALLSGGAGIYTEFLMKKNPKSIHVQNAQLYTFSMISNLLLYILWERDQNKEIWLGVMPNLIALNTALSGLAASFLLKYADNIVKVYSSGMAVIFTALISMWLLKFIPSINFWLGTVIVIISVDIYYMKVNNPPPVLPIITTEKLEKSEQANSG